MDPNVGNEEGHGATAPGKSREGTVSVHKPAPVGTPVGTPVSTPGGAQDGTPTGVGVERTPAWTPAGRETGSVARFPNEPAHRPAGTADGTYGPRYVAGRGAGHAGGEGLPAHTPVRRAIEPARAVDAGRGAGQATPAVPPGGGQRPVGGRAQPAPGTPSWSTKFPLVAAWVDGSLLVRQAQEILGPSQGGARDLYAGRPHGGSLTQRGPPLRVPSPFSGFGLVMGAATGLSSSSDGSAPLLAVIFSCLSFLLLGGQSRAYGALLRAGTVPRLALERPG